MPWTQQPKADRPLRSMRVAVPTVRVERPKSPPRPPKPPEIEGWKWRWQKQTPFFISSRTTSQPPAGPLQSFQS